MNSSDCKGQSRPSAAVRAEAAVWLTRLHGPNRTREVEAGLRRWLAEDPERAAAFELLTDTWEKSARLRRTSFGSAASSERAAIRLSFSRAALATAAVAILAVLGTLYVFHDAAVRTGVGEQRTLVLEDGSRVHMNTATRMAVRYDRKERRIDLESGEALFEVAKQANRPFIVAAGDRQVRALGTSFIVRRDARQLAVTLVEGSISITPVAVDIAVAAPEMITTLKPGERLTLRHDEGAEARSAHIDRPPLDKLTAWQRGQVALDSTPLAEAVEEMNRYSPVQIVVESPAAARINVSGIFRAGDSADFAQAVARTYRLRAVERDGEIVLSDMPAHGS